MPIRFRCEGCQARIKVPDGTYGRKVKCPRCAMLQRVPAEEDIRAQQAEPAPESPRDPLTSGDPDSTTEMPPMTRRDRPATAAQQHAATDHAASPGRRPPSPPAAHVPEAYYGDPNYDPDATVVQPAIDAPGGAGRTVAGMRHAAAWATADQQDPGHAEDPGAGTDADDHEQADPGAAADATAVQPAVDELAEAAAPADTAGDELQEDEEAGEDPASREADRSGEPETAQPDAAAQDDVDEDRDEQESESDADTATDDDRFIEDDGDAFQETDEEAGDDDGAMALTGVPHEAAEGPDGEDFEDDSAWRGPEATITDQDDAEDEQDPDDALTPGGEDELDDAWTAGTEPQPSTAYASAGRDAEPSSDLDADAPDDQGGEPLAREPDVDDASHPDDPLDVSAPEAWDTGATEPSAAGHTAVTPAGEQADSEPDDLGDDDVQHDAWGQRAQTPATATGDLDDADEAQGSSDAATSYAPDQPIASPVASTGSAGFEAVEPPTPTGEVSEPERTEEPAVPTGTPAWAVSAPMASEPHKEAQTVGAEQIWRSAGPAATGAESDAGEDTIDEDPIDNSDETQVDMAAVTDQEHEQADLRHLPDLDHPVEPREQAREAPTAAPPAAGGRSAPPGVGATVTGAAIGAAVGAAAGLAAASGSRTASPSQPTQTAPAATPPAAPAHPAPAPAPSPAPAAAPAQTTPSLMPVALAPVGPVLPPPRYGMLIFVISFMRILALLTTIVAVAAPWSDMTRGEGESLIYRIGAMFLGLILAGIALAVGEVCKAIRDIARNSFRR